MVENKILKNKYTPFFECSHSNFDCSQSQSHLHVVLDESFCLMTKCKVHLNAAIDSPCNRNNKLWMFPKQKYYKSNKADLQ